MWLDQGPIWQIVPENLEELMAVNPAKTTPVMLERKKITIEELIRAGAENSVQ